MEKGIHLLGEILRDPAFPVDEFEQMKLRSAARMSSMESDPAALSGELLSGALSQYPKGDVRYVSTMKESLEELNSATLDLGRTFAYTAEREKKISALTVSDIKSAFQKHIDPEKLIVIRVGDLK